MQSARQSGTPVQQQPAYVIKTPPFKLSQHTVGRQSQSQVSPCDTGLAAHTPVFRKRSSLSRSSQNCSPIQQLQQQFPSVQSQFQYDFGFSRECVNNNNTGDNNDAGNENYSPYNGNTQIKTPAFNRKKKSVYTAKSFAQSPVRSLNLNNVTPRKLDDGDAHSSPQWMTPKVKKTNRAATVQVDDDLVKQLNAVSISPRVQQSQDTSRLCIEAAMRRLSMSAERRRHNGPASAKKVRDPLLNTPTAWNRAKVARKTSSQVNGNDRFVPQRNQDDQAAASYLLNKSVKQVEQDMSVTIQFSNVTSVSKQSTDHGHTLTSADLTYQSELAKACGMSIDKRLLSFSKQKKAMSTNEKDIRAKYLNKSMLSQKNISARRKIPTAPEKVLDAPGIIDDYYLNLLDWSCQNVVAISLGPTVYIWNASSGETSELYTTEDEEDISSVSWASDGLHLSVGDFKGMTHLINVEKQKRVRMMPQVQSSARGHHINSTVAESMAKIGVMHWNRTLLSTGTADGNLIHHDVRLPRSITALNKDHHEGDVCGLKWNIDGTMLASGGNDNMLHIWDVRNLNSSRLTKQEHSGAVRALAWCPWQSGLLASGGGVVDKRINVWNMTTDVKTGAIDTGAQVTALQWSKSYKEIVSSHGYSDQAGAPQNHLTIWKYPTFKKVIDLPNAHDSRILHMSLSPDGQTVCTGAADENLKFWKLFAFDSKSVKTKGKSSSSSAHTIDGLIKTSATSPDFGAGSSVGGALLRQQSDDSNSAVQSPMRVTGRQRSSSMSTSAQNQGDRMASNSATPTSAKTTDGNYRRMTLFEPTVADDQSFLGKNTSMDALAQAFGGGSSNSYTNNNKRSSRAFDEKKISSISAVVQGPMVKTGDQYGSRNISPLPQKISTDYERDFTLQAKSYHYYSSDETAMCCQWINENLMPHLDPDLSHLFTDTFPELPTHPPECDEALFKACQDGWLLAKVINFVVPNSIDFKAMKRNPKSKAHVTENIQVMLRGAKQIGVKMNNIGSEDVYKGVPHLILALTWQIIKLGLLSKVDITANPLLNQLLTENERQGDVTKINNETLLLKWVNFHLNAASCDLKISNFNGDLKDGQVLMNLLRQLSHGHENEQFIAELYQANISATSVRERAECALQMADEMGVRSLITVDDIINGNKDHAIAFIAQLLNKFPNLEESMQSKVAFVQKQSVDNLLGSVNNISKQQTVQATPSADDHILQLQKEVAALRQELDAERDKNATLQIDHAQLDGAYQMLDRQHSSIVTELQLTKDKLMQSNQELMQTNQTLDKFRADYQQVTAQVQSLKLQSSSEQSQSLKLRNEVEMLQNVVNREQNDRQQLEQTLELQRQERAKDSDLIRKLQIQISGISSSSGGEKLLLERIKLSLINFKQVESYEELPDVTSLACSQLSNTMIELTALKESFAKILNEKQKLAEQDIPNLTRSLKQSEDRVNQIQEQSNAEKKELQQLLQKADCMSKDLLLSSLQAEVQKTSKELAKAEERLQDLQEQSRQSGPEMEQRMMELKRQLQEKSAEADKWQQTCRAISKDQIESSHQSTYKYQQYNLNGKIQEILSRVKRLNDEVVQCK